MCVCVCVFSGRAARACVCLCNFSGIDACMCACVCVFSGRAARACVFVSFSGKNACVYDARRRRRAAATTRGRDDARPRRVRVCCFVFLIEMHACVLVCVFGACGAVCFVFSGKNACVCVCFWGAQRVRVFCFVFRCCGGVGFDFVFLGARGARQLFSLHLQTNSFHYNSTIHSFSFNKIILFLNLH